ncbi:winged helix DNA-binding protein (plasmid) [Streptomyces sp. NBC_01260]|uniref:MarR family winged helix-turn-helix transcriptional regulator n=1 Tax=unclassified Streptomyces TaxID=2593676 RepID=UPI000F473A11|nr:MULTISPECIES: MarR family transcriptional regulator [unclassified Streptomyces]MCX4775225.1 winged helix DNA-binding protein [Streptomyces sp. NBC_01285]ROQ65360.1 MarR family transcriptional regulator [Streptomyces sp. CEV 2-1]RPK32922.1 MarR family protein [Streptomyces sp. ADI92-24]
MTTRPEKPYERQVPLPTLLAQAKDLTIDQLHRQLHEEGYEGVRFRHGSVFRFVDPEGTRLTVLADRSGFSKQAIAEVVDELERFGYLERTADPRDRRAKLIHLTERGRAAQLAAARILGDMERMWARHFGRDGIDMMRRMLEDIITRRIE